MPERSVPFRPQKTIRRPVQVEGVGVHGGQGVRLRLEPASADAGLRFIRADLSGEPAIPVRPASVRRNGVQRMTLLESSREDGSVVEVGMTEHLLAACSAAGVTNLTIRLDAPECPILDGSALDYWRLLEEAELQEQERPARVWRLRRPVCLTAPDADIVALPADRMRLTFFAEFRNRGFADQQATFDVERDDFRTEIAPARTFAFEEEIEAMRQAGLIQGGSPDCAIVIGDGKPINTAYRLQNELARHKLLDLLGDLGVLGAPVLAAISARKTGHALHHEFIDRMKEELTDE